MFKDLWRRILLAFIGWLTALLPKGDKPEVFKDIELVEEFHEFYGHPINAAGYKPTPAEMSTRVLMLLEEVIELAEASGTYAIMHLRGALGEHAAALEEKYLKHTNGVSRILSPMSRMENWKEVNVDVIAIQDALSDIRYFTAGTVLVAGLVESDKKAFEIIHNNNMEKYCKSDNDLYDSGEHYADKKQITVMVEKRYHPRLKKHVTVIKCLTDYTGKVPHGKVLKPLSYEKVDIKEAFKVLPMLLLFLLMSCTSCSKTEPIEVYDCQRHDCEAYLDEERVNKVIFLEKHLQISNRDFNSLEDAEKTYEKLVDEVYQLPYNRVTCFCYE